MRLTMAVVLATTTLATQALAQTTPAVPPTVNSPTTGIVANPPAPMIRAIEEMLSPEARAALQRRATGGNTVNGVLETELLNNLQVLDARGLGARIIAIDFTREVLVASIANEPPKVYRFDRRTLTVRAP